MRWRLCVLWTLALYRATLLSTLELNAESRLHHRILVDNDMNGIRIQPREAKNVNSELVMEDMGEDVLG